MTRIRGPSCACPSATSRSSSRSGTRARHLEAALKLFAEGRLPRVGREPVDVVIGLRKLGPMVLTEVRCGGHNDGHDIAVLVFRPVAVADSEAL